MLAVLLAHRRREGAVARLGRLALRVQDAQDAGGAPFDEVDAALVVLVLDGRPVHLLVGVRLLLGLEDEAEEELLQLLVGEVDRELLERVVRAEELEAEDVEQADEARALLRVARDGRVDRGDDPLEEARVHRLGQRVASMRRLLGGEGHEGGLTAHGHRAVGQAPGDLRLQELARRRGDLRVDDGRRVLAREAHVAHVEHPRQQGPHLRLLRRGHATRAERGGEPRVHALVGQRGDGVHLGRVGVRVGSRV